MEELNQKQGYCVDTVDESDFDDNVVHHYLAGEIIVPKSDLDNKEKPSEIVERITR